MLEDKYNICEHDWPKFKEIITELDWHIRYRGVRMEVDGKPVLVAQDDPNAEYNNASKHFQHLVISRYDNRYYLLSPKLFHHAVYPFTNDKLVQLLIALGNSGIVVKTLKEVKDDEERQKELEDANKSLEIAI